MAGPYYKADKYGVVKLSDQAPSFQRGDGVTPDQKTSGNEARGAGGLPGGTSGTSSDSKSPQVPPAVLEAAKNGDPNALKILEMLGIGAATAGAGYGVYRYLKGRKGKDNTSPEVKDAEVKSQGRYMTPREPDVTPVTDEQIIPRTSGYLQPQNKLPVAPEAANEVDSALKARKLLKAQAVARALTHLIP